uniref:hypothetical protein n=1 Tax=Streptomyces laurentii TaxID=39478 RepID=UPI0015E85CE6|nr:hypothetical protein [Streptomyces laurentii]
MELARRQGALEAAVTQTAPAAETSASILPRWAVGTAVASVGIGAEPCLLGWALDLLATGAAAVAAGESPPADPQCILIGAVLDRQPSIARSAPKGGGIEVTQTITQTITQSVKGGGRR